MKVGILTVFFHYHNQVVNVYTYIFLVLRKLRELGCACIEMDSGSLPHPSSTKREDMIEVVKVVCSRGLEVSSIHIGNDPGDMGSSDKITRQEALLDGLKGVLICVMPSK